jgi:hypothetical protein
MTLNLGNSGHIFGMPLGYNIVHTNLVLTEKFVFLVHFSQFVKLLAI